MRNPPKRPHSPVPVTPLKLRNGRVIVREELDMATEGPSIDAAPLTMDHVSESIPLNVQAEDFDFGQQFVEEKSFELEDQNMKAEEEYFDTASDEIMQMEEDSQMMPPPPPFVTDNSVPSNEQLSDFSQSVPESQISSDYQVPLKQVRLKLFASLLSSLFVLSRAQSEEEK
jgi:hypothetical protein